MKEINIKTIEPKELFDMIACKNVIIIDVRESFEHNKESIFDSVLIPLMDLTESKLPNCKNKNLVFYCQVGSRSLVACKMLRMKGIKLDLYNLCGGIVAWKNAGYKVKTK